MVPGKVFIGGIPRNADEECLKNYFQTFGQVVELVIMKDHLTCLSRGFGFIVFDDPADAERVVVKQKHMINGRFVESRKAVPKEDLQTPNRTGCRGQGYQRFNSTKKIFVGGLASSVTESDFKKYFEQFGTTTDAVVMFDHNTNRSKGFGFITFDSDEAVNRVLSRNFHEINGKIAEVKWAIPRELRLLAIKSQLSGLNQVTNLPNAYTQGYRPIRVGAIELDMNSMFSSGVGDRSGYPSGNVVGPNLEPALGPHLEGSGHHVSYISPGNGLIASQNGNRNRVSNPVKYGLGVGGTGSVLTSMSQNRWDESPNYAHNLTYFDEYMGSGSQNTGMVNALDSIGAKWDSLSISGQERGSAFSNGIINYENAESRFGMTEVGNAITARGDIAPSYVAANSGHVGSSASFRGIGSVYGDTDRRTLRVDLEGPNSLGYNLRNAVSEVTPRKDVGYIGDHNFNYK